MKTDIKRNFLIFLVSIVAASMVFSYLPLFIQPAPVTDINETASVVPVPTPLPKATSTEKSKPVPSSFNGLEEEGRTVDDLNNSLNGK